MTKEEYKEMLKDIFCNNAEYEIMISLWWANFNPISQQYMEFAEYRRKQNQEKEKVEMTEIEKKFLEYQGYNQVEIKNWDNDRDYEFKKSREFEYFKKGYEQALKFERDRISSKIDGWEIKE